MQLTSQLSEVAFFLENEAPPIFRAEKGDLGEVERVTEWRAERNRIVAVISPDLRVERSGTEWGGRGLTPAGD